MQRIYKILLIIIAVALLLLIGMICLFFIAIEKYHREQRGSDKIPSELNKLENFILHKMVEEHGDMGKSFTYFFFQTLDKNTMIIGYDTRKSIIISSFDHNFPIKKDDYDKFLKTVENLFDENQSLENLITTYKLSRFKERKLIEDVFLKLLKSFNVIIQKKLEENKTKKFLHEKDELNIQFHLSIYNGLISTLEKMRNEDRLICLSYKKNNKGYTFYEGKYERFPSSETKL